jgi:lactoylglutathione lyase
MGRVNWMSATIIYACLLLGIAQESARGAAPAVKPSLPPSFGLIFASEQVRDMDRSLAFYTTLFEMRVLNTYRSPDGEITEQQLVFTDTLAAGGINLIQHEPKIVRFEGDRAIHLVIRVHDIQATCDRVSTAGGKITRAPADAAGSGIWVAMLHDPDGHQLEIVQYQ